jgi:nickel-dependent lactate racemase
MNTSVGDEGGFAPALPSNESAIELILEKLEKSGITDIHLISAICLHRKMTKEEFQEMLGTEIVEKFYPAQLYNHDAEDRENMKYLGETEEREKVYINKRTFESDLVIYVNINFVSMDGGHKSFGTGLADYHTVRHNHNYNTLMNSKSYFDPENSMLHNILTRQGKLIEKNLKAFHIPIHRYYFFA